MDKERLSKTAKAVSVFAACMAAVAGFYALLFRLVAKMGWGADVAAAIGFSVVGLAAFGIIYYNWED